MTTHSFRTPDHPEANGRKPKPNDVQYPLHFSLEDGSRLVISMGEAGFQNLTNLLMDMLTNAPSHNDGSVPSVPPENS